jgi:hypothetical protein
VKLSVILSKAADAKDLAAAIFRGRDNLQVFRAAK